MGTPFGTVIDRALITIKDFGLNKLFDTDNDRFENILKSYLIKAIPQFTQCMKSLNYDEMIEEFDETLNQSEINILADYTVIVWYESNLQDVLEFKEALQDKEFKRYSTGQNLNPRQEYLTTLYTRVKQEGQNYQTLDDNFASLPFFGGTSSD